MNILLPILFIGIGATAVMDLWGIVRKPLLGIPLPNYRMVGRWIAHMTHGQFRHSAIAASPPMRGEHVIGWTAHYLIGIAFAALFIGIWGGLMDSQSSDWPRARGWHRHCCSALFSNAARYGVRYCRFQNTTSDLRPTAESHNAYSFWSRLICIRLGLAVV